MEINYELKPEDFYQFSKENAPTQSTHKPLVMLYLITYLVFVFADILYAIFSGKALDFGELMVSILIRSAICFGALMVVLGLIKLFVNRKTKEILAQPQNGLFCEHRIILTEHELIELTDVNTSRYSWKAIGEIKELENFIAVEVAMSASYIIPKKYFESRAEARKFVETANFYKQNAAHAFQPSHFIEYDKRLEQ